MALGPIGKADPLDSSALEELWTRLAIYLQRSSVALREAWDLDARRVRALPVFRNEPPTLGLTVAVANAASFSSHEGLLAYAASRSRRIAFSRSYRSRIARIR